MAISPHPTHSSHVRLMRNSTLSRRKAAATTASLPGRRRAATETHGRTRWRATRGCTTSRRFPWRNPCYARIGTSWRWSTAGSPPCQHSAACCKNSTERCLCPSGPVSIQTQGGNHAASHFPETVGSTLYWLPPLPHLIRENRSTTSWTGPETQVKHFREYLRNRCHSFTGSTIRFLLV